MSVTQKVPTAVGAPEEVRTAVGPRRPASPPHRVAPRRAESPVDSSRADVARGPRQQPGSRHRAEQ